MMRPDIWSIVSHGRGTWVKKYVLADGEVNELYHSICTLLNQRITELNDSVREHRILANSRFICREDHRIENLGRLHGSLGKSHPLQDLKSSLAIRYVERGDSH